MGINAGNFTTIGSGGNVGIGNNALAVNTVGASNTGLGYNALASNTQANGNTALGSTALQLNTTGGGNTAIGSGTLFSNTTGTGNTAIGAGALPSSTGSNNIAIGVNAGNVATTGSNNIYIANSGVAAESNTIRIGTSGSQSAAYMEGIFGQSTAVSGIPMYIDATHKLGTIVSSKRFKHDINAMAADSEMIYHLNPVTFAYNSDASETKQYGLIAEEVDQVFPGIVVKDEDGQPYTVQYQVLPVLLLNELIKQHAAMERMDARIAALEEQA
jgi:hypothetical protein